VKMRKVIWWLSLLIVIAGWPVSLIAEPPKMETELVWQLDDAAEEKRILTQKLGLDSSQIKKIFYNTKTTIPSSRYIKNVLVMVDMNNYFFGKHPQAEVTEGGYRMKFPYVAIIGFLAGVYESVKRKKYIKLWLGGGVVVLVVSVFKNIDGWDMAMYPLLVMVTIEGLKEINKYKFGWILLLLTVVIGATEIGRLIR
jgi:hypothetical protein